MSDIYDEMVKWYTENPKFILGDWNYGIGLFKAICGAMYDYKDCPVGIKFEPSHHGEQYREQIAELPIVNVWEYADIYIFNRSNGPVRQIDNNLINSLPAFADAQRIIDTHFGLVPEAEKWHQERGAGVND